MVHRLVGAAVVGALCLLTTTASTTASTAAAKDAPPVHAGQVTVTARWSVSRLVAVVTLTPDRPGFHLYGLTPATTKLGIPTRIEVTGGARVAGEASADRAITVLHYPALDVDLSVYPDGPVTVTVPLTLIGTHPPELLITYAACSDSVCLAPVRALPVTPSRES